MQKFKPVLWAALFAATVYTPASQAEKYATEVANKFTRGAANLMTGMGEIPKNVVYISSKTNPLIGVTGGLVMGALNAVGRTATGLFDIVTSPIPSKPIIQPEFVWSNVDKSTVYGTARPAVASVNRSQVAPKNAQTSRNSSRTVPRAR